MKKILSLLLVLSLLLPACCFAEVEKVTVGGSVFYRLEPGLYEIGVDIPAGTYDVRAEAGDVPLILSFSELLDFNDQPDLSYFYSWQISVLSKKWAGGCHPVVMFTSFGYFLVQGKSCRLYPVETGY